MDTDKTGQKTFNWNLNLKRKKEKKARNLRSRVDEVFL